MVNLPFSIPVVCPQERSEHVPTFAIGVYFERFLSASMRSWAKRAQ